MLYLFDGVLSNPGEKLSFSSKPEDCATVREYFESRQEGCLAWIRNFSGKGEFYYFILRYCNLKESRKVEIQTQEGLTEFYYSEYEYGGGGRREWYYVPVTPETTILHESEDGRSALLSIADRLDEYEDAKFLPVRHLAEILFDDEIPNSDVRALSLWVTADHLENYRSREERLREQIQFKIDCYNDPDVPNELLGFF